MAKDPQRADARAESDVVEHRTATADRPDDAAVTSRHGVTERELAVRLNRRGERGATAMGITWL